MTETLSPVTLWLIAGIIFIIIEMFLPGLIIGFFGLGALITCLTTYIGLTNDMASQIVIFTITSVGSLILFHKVIKKKKKRKKEEETTDFNLQLGKLVPVTELIDPDEGPGKVRYQGAQWSASSKDKLAPGDMARVVGCDNLTLIVEKK